MSGKATAGRVAALCYNEPNPHFQEQIMVSKDRFDALAGRMDSAERNIMELTRAVGRIEGSLAEIRWTNRLLVGGVILLVIKEWLWPLLS